jgi:transcription elongation factor Elf1
MPMAADDELCIHDMPPSQCSICLHRDDKTIKRSPSTVSQHRTLVCPVCGRSLPETSFPTDKNKERRTDTCRECEKYVVAQVKTGVDRAEAWAKRRRQFLG